MIIASCPLLEAGDSGSPLFGWNTAKGQWELVGVYSGVGGGPI